MPRLPERLRLPAARRFQQTVAGVAGRATPAMYRAFDALASYDEEAVAILTRQTSTTIAAVKAASVRSAVGYYTVLSGVRPPPIAVADVATVADMRAPFISVWTALDAGRSYADAVASGRSHFEAVVSNFAVSSARQTGDVFVAKADIKIRGWVRVPEAGACDWCQMLTGNLYKSAETADFGHDRCHCTADPAFD